MKPITIIILVVLFLAVLVMGFYLFAKNKMKEGESLPPEVVDDIGDVVEAPVDEIVKPIFVPLVHDCPKDVILIPVFGKEWYCSGTEWALRTV